MFSLTCGLPLGGLTHLRLLRCKIWGPCFWAQGYGAWANISLDSGRTRTSKRTRNISSLPKVFSPGCLLPLSIREVRKDWCILLKRGYVHISPTVHRGNCPHSSPGLIRVPRYVVVVLYSCVHVFVGTTCDGRQTSRQSLIAISPQRDELKEDKLLVLRLNGTY